MNAIISKGGKTAHVQLPVGRRQLAGALAYLGEYHANEYDLIVFVGFVIIYVGAVTINCLFNGFDGFVSNLCDLPYLLYLLLSLILSIVFILRINRVTKA